MEVTKENKKNFNITNRWKWKFACYSFPASLTLLSTTGFLNLGTIDAVDWTIPFVGNCPVQYQHVLQDPLPPSQELPVVLLLSLKMWPSETSPDIGEYPLEAKFAPQLTITALEGNNFMSFTF